MKEQLISLYGKWENVKIYIKKQFMNELDRSYQRLLFDILNNGTEKKDSN